MRFSEIAGTAIDPDGCVVLLDLGSPSRFSQGIQGDRFYREGRGLANESTAQYARFLIKKSLATNVDLTQGQVDRFVASDLRPMAFVAATSVQGLAFPEAPVG